MRITLRDARLAEEVKAKARAKQVAAKDAPPRHIKQVSDEELEAMPLRDIAQLEGVTVKKATISGRIKNENMSLREAAQTPPRTPRKVRPDNEAKRRFCGYSP